MSIPAIFYLTSCLSFAGVSIHWTGLLGGGGGGGGGGGEAQNILGSRRHYP